MTPQFVDFVVRLSPNIQNVRRPLERSEDGEAVAGRYYSTYCQDLW